MPCPASDREAIEAEIAHVRSLGLDELHTLWRLTFRSAPPPAFTKDLMARFLCWDIQEQAFGGLDPDTAKLLEGFARGGRPGADAPRRLKPGTVLVCEYQGERAHRHGREATHASLSTIARAITGTAWSGPRFFGLRACVNRLAEIEGDQTGFRRVRARADPRAYRGRPKATASRTTRKR